MADYADDSASSTVRLADAAGLSPIDRSLVELAEARVRLMDRLECLEGKLASVLTPAPPRRDHGQAGPAPASMVRVRIDNEAEVLDVLAVRVAALIDRLEV